MKSLILFLLLLCSTSAFAQDVYYVRGWVPVKPVPVVVPEARLELRRGILPNTYRLRSRVYIKVAQ